MFADLYVLLFQSTPNKEIQYNTIKRSGKKSRLLQSTDKKSVLKSQQILYIANKIVIENFHQPLQNVKSKMNIKTIHNEIIEKNKF